MSLSKFGIPIALACTLLVGALAINQGRAINDGQGKREFDPLGDARKRINEWAKERFEAGSDLKKIEEEMKGSYRDRGIARLGGTGSYKLYFLLDDYHQICFIFDRFDKLQGDPGVQLAGKWLKGPNSELLRFPE